VSAHIPVTLGCIMGSGTCVPQRLFSLIDMLMLTLNINLPLMEMGSVSAPHLVFALLEELTQIITSCHNADWNVDELDCLNRLDSDIHPQLMTVDAFRRVVGVIADNHKVI